MVPISKIPVTTTYSSITPNNNSCKTMVSKFKQLHFYTKYLTR